MAESTKEGVRQFVITQQTFGQDQNRRSRVDAQKKLIDQSQEISSHRSLEELMIIHS